jgi:hypothetical protein
MGTDYTRDFHLYLYDGRIDFWTINNIAVTRHSLLHIITSIIVILYVCFVYTHKWKNTSTFVIFGVYYIFSIMYLIALEKFFSALLHHVSDISGPAPCTNCRIIPASRRCIITFVLLFTRTVCHEFPEG